MISSLCVCVCVCMCVWDIFSFWESQNFGGSVFTCSFWKSLWRIGNQFSSLLSHVQLFATPQHARPPCPSLTPAAFSNSCPLSRWCHPTISSSVVPFFSSFQSLPVSGCFPMSPLFTSGGQIIGASASASALPMNIQAWFPLGLTGLISLQSKGPSRVFFSTTDGKHQFFGAQPSLWSNSHICTWLLKRP